MKPDGATHVCRHTHRHAFLKPAWSRGLPAPRLHLAVLRVASSGPPASCSDSLRGARAKRSDWVASVPSPVRGTPQAGGWWSQTPPVGSPVRPYVRPYGPSALLAVPEGQVDACTWAASQLGIACDTPSLSAA